MHDEGIVPESKNFFDQKGHIYHFPHIAHGCDQFVLVFGRNSAILRRRNILTQKKGRKIFRPYCLFN